MSDFSWDDLTEKERGRAAVGVSEQLARGRHADYDRVVAHVAPKLKDEGFRDKIFQAEDPAEALYEAGQREIHTPLEDIFGD